MRLELPRPPWKGAQGQRMAYKSTPRRAFTDEDRLQAQGRPEAQMAVRDDPVRFYPAERFDLSYIGEDGEKHRPVMLHRVILGASSVHGAYRTPCGAFPLWLSPVQATLVT